MNSGGVNISEPAQNKFSYTHKYVTSDIHQNPSVKGITYYYYQGGSIPQTKPDFYSNSVTVTNLNCTDGACTQPPRPTIGQGHTHDSIFVTQTKKNMLIGSNIGNGYDDEINYLEHTVQRYQYALIDTMLKTGDTTELITYLDSSKTFFTIYQLAKIYLQQRKFDSVANLITALPALAGYNREIEVYGNFLALQSQAEQNYRNDSFCQTLRTAITAIAEDTVWIAAKAKVWINYLNATMEITDTNDRYLLDPTYTFSYTSPTPLISLDSLIAVTPVIAYPNPVSTQLFVEIENDINISRTFIVELYNGLGGLERNTSLVIPANSTQIGSLDVSLLSEDTYYLRVTSDGKIINQQPIIKN